MPVLTCEHCGQVFVCNPEGDCWCKSVPAVLPVPPEGVRCLCPCQLRSADPAQRIPTTVPDDAAEE